MKSIYELQSSFKSSGTAFLMWFFLGAQYAYLGKWGVQLLYWVTLGGCGIWTLIDLFRISGMVKRYNANIALQIEVLESRKK